MLILASTSPWRRMLLERLQLPFETASPEVDETPLPEETVAEMVRRLSRAKAEAVARQHPEAFVIGSDQSAEADGMILHKPGSYARAFEQLRHLSGRTVTFHTGLCVCHAGRCVETMDRSVTHFRPLDDTLIDWYLKKERPYNCAGAIKSEGLGALLIERIENDDPAALIGLPLLKLVDLLNELNYPFPWQTRGSSH